MGGFARVDGDRGRWGRTVVSRRGYSMNYLCLEPPPLPHNILFKISLSLSLNDSDSSFREDHVHNLENEDQDENWEIELP